MRLLNQKPRPNNTTNKKLIRVHVTTIATMASTKKNAVNKSANRPCRSVAPPDTNKMASTYSSRSIKNGGRVTKTRSNKSKKTFAYLNTDDAEDDDYKPSGVLSKSISSEFDHDTVEDPDDEFIVDKKVKSKATRISKQKAKPSTKTDNKAATNKFKVQTETQPKTKKDGTLPDPHGRVKGRDLIPWTRKLTNKFSLKSEALIPLYLGSRYCAYALCQQDPQKLTTTFQAHVCLRSSSSTCSMRPSWRVLGFLGMLRFTVYMSAQTKELLLSNLPNCGKFF